MLTILTYIFVFKSWCGQERNQRRVLSGAVSDGFGQYVRRVSASDWRRFYQAGERNFCYFLKKSFFLGECFLLVKREN